MATPEGNSIPATVSGVLRLDAAPGGGLLLPYDCAGIAAVVVAGRGHFDALPKHLDQEGCIVRRGNRLFLRKHADVACLQRRR